MSSCGDCRTLGSKAKFSITLGFIQGLAQGNGLCLSSYKYKDDSHDLDDNYNDDNDDISDDDDDYQDDLGLGAPLSIYLEVALYKFHR